YAKIKNGGVGERLKPAVLKTVRPERVSGVRIPPPPPRSPKVLACLLDAGGSRQASTVFAQGFLCGLKSLPQVRLSLSAESQRCRPWSGARGYTRGPGPWLPLVDSSG